MMDPLEQAVLSGELFAGRNRSPSPARSLSPDHPANSNYPSSSGGGLKEWPTEEWEGSYQYPSSRSRSHRSGIRSSRDDVEEDSDDDVLDEIEDTRFPSKSRSLSSRPSNLNPPPSAGAGGGTGGAGKAVRGQYGSARGSATGQTGVKGVLRDSSLASSSSNLERAEAERERKRVWLRGDLGGLTYAEEQALDRRTRGDEDQEDEEGGEEGGGKAFGHLREVVESNFVRAVEGEGRDTWVVMHIYHPTLERCATLDQDLVLLARSYPSVKFLHARADKLGFASLSSSSSSSGNPSSSSYANGSIRNGGGNPYSIPEEYDLNSDDDFEDYDEDEYPAPASTQKTDLDVLPTLLVYKGGQLIHTWVRVDWIVESEVGASSGSGNGGGNGKEGGKRGGGGMMFRREEGEDGGIKELLEK
ncbi:hypothetical protein SISSUDRAFT_66428 [Sistotremastrum suecicum HHB10207 ss-3]|uniref:Phosducin domain-containing protein n=1 Tax=Sistotremastrum suecicum HHB10207 ss-3 TaxID=1314776 RepID=A0A166BJB0_9AGAM|nr:hypothetical protein SISSUDRAFT_66428 [Sistotremastrum suecicum HHB10207 ss-3]